ncbi:phosphotransferase family protein [Sphingorhabdus lutea]|uniref:Phosphotransferase family protein n=1 Tax=Sphingorhabdus lutea TaxID=1913578 RepID=A0A1L3JC21_9SPHN|nr:phosphotransferase family protein [Sphingorhabdus lutea]APG62697.1 phosphotransferase family protein [Sphingorhabdus lutea]
MTNQTNENPIPIDLDALQSWMDKIGLESGPLINVNLLAGGTQNILLRFDRGGKEFVLRRPPLHLRKNSNDTMMREARVLEALTATNVPHPKFIASCDDTDVLGAYFYLMAPVDGFNPANGLPQLHASDPAIRNRMGYSYIEGMAALGAIDYKMVGLEGFGKPEGFLKRQSSRWMQQLESYASFDHWTGFKELPNVDKIVSWLDDNLPEESVPGILHGDCHLANTMFSHDSAELAAFVDWELATIGDPLIDLGWVMATWADEHTAVVGDIKPWEGFPKLDELISYYDECSPRNLDAVNWYGVLACFKLGSILEGTHARASAGKAPKETGDSLHMMTISLFDRAHRLIAKN